MSDSNTKSIGIDSEKSRTYHYAGGAEFTVPTPVSVDVITDDRGVTHRVISANGATYRPERGWLGISWTPKDGAPAYVA